MLPDELHLVLVETSDEKRNRVRDPVEHRRKDLNERTVSAIGLSIYKNQTHVRRENHEVFLDCAPYFLFVPRSRERKDNVCENRAM